MKRAGYAQHGRHGGLTTALLVVVIVGAACSSSPDQGYGDLGVYEPGAKSDLTVAPTLPEGCRARGFCRDDSDCASGQSCRDCAIHYGYCLHCQGYTRRCVSATPCHGDADCAPTGFCVIDEPRHMGCPSEALPGGCIPLLPDRPCILLLTPACGCDGKTYSNECFTNAAGTGIAHRGACAP